MTRKKKLLLVTATAAVAAGATVGGVLARGDEPPGPPAWASANGTVDTSQLPDTFGVDGPDGQPIICADGKELRVKAKDLIGPPEDAPGQAKKATRAGVEGEQARGKDRVPRCGPKGGDGPPIWVELPDQAGN